jgi:hypothetical protein
MRHNWQRLLVRINALSVRERFLVFACAMVLLGAATEEIFIGPLTKLQAQHARELEKRSAQMEATRERLEKQVMLTRRVRVTELEADIAMAQSQLQAVEREITQLDGAASDVPALRAVLTKALRQSDKVALVRVTTSEGPTAPAAGSTASPAGIEITLAGSYLDLMDYLANLQAALPHARWGALRVNAEVTPAQATLRIVTRPAT